MGLIFLTVLCAGCATTQGKRTETSADSQSAEKTAGITGEDVSVSDEIAAPEPVKPAVIYKALTSKQIQRALAKAGYYSAAIDGKIGPKTRKAIVEFQKAQGLKPDGIVGKKTTAALREYLP
jgi:peptidoglycan hydrolase-like protein with peptidoglycan-binding domain